MHAVHMAFKCSIATGAVHREGDTWAWVHGALTSAATAALLVCFGTAGSADAAEVPADNKAVTADQTTDINDRQGWEDDTEQPLVEREPFRCDGPAGPRATAAAALRSATAPRLCPRHSTGASASRSRVLR